MKIHKKILSHYQSCNSPIDKEGYLQKKGERNTSYQKRWFTLKGNLLFYKDRASDRELLGVIVLEGCSVQLCESDEQFAFSLVWSEPGLRTYKFAADDQEAQEGWIKALLSANHSYLALLVTDMEKLYQDALRANPTEPSKNFTLPSSNMAANSFTWLHTGSSTLPPYLAPDVGARSTFGPNQMLQVSPKPSGKRSPKLWPKRNANVGSMTAPVAPQMEWPSVMAGGVQQTQCKEEFSKLHEDFGKEVKELIAARIRSGHKEEVAEENLINFE